MRESFVIFKDASALDNSMGDVCVHIKRQNQDLNWYVVFSNWTDKNLAMKWVKIKSWVIFFFPDDGVMIFFSFLYFYTK